MTFKQQLFSLLEYYGPTCPECRIYGDHDRDCEIRRKIEKMVAYVASIEKRPKEYIIAAREVNAHLTNEGIRRDAKGLAMRFKTREKASEAIDLYRNKNNSELLLDVEEVDA